MTIYAGGEVVQWSFGYDGGGVVVGVGLAPWWLLWRMANWVQLAKVWPSLHWHTVDSDIEAKRVDVVVRRAKV